MFNKISINNFRGITQLEIDDLQRINLFVGKNNCGKTSVLEAVFLLIGASNPQLPVTINNFRGVGKIDEDFWRSIFKDLNFDSPVTLKAELENPKEKRLLMIKGFDNDFSDNNLTPPKDAYSGLSAVFNGLKLEYTFTSKMKKSQKISTSVIAKGSGLEFKVAEDYQETIFGSFINSRRLLGDFIENFDKIQRLKRTADIVKILKKIEPSIGNLLIGSGERIYCDVGIERLIPVSMMGDGILGILSIIVAICNAQNGILLIDEIENGFHYSSQKILWDAVIETAQKFNVQIFATTHSIECIRSLSSSIAGLDKKDDIVRLFRIERKDKQFRAITYNQQLIDASLSSDWEVR